jgi:hypothetical protein
MYASAPNFSVLRFFSCAGAGTDKLNASTPNNKHPIKNLAFMVTPISAAADTS